MSSCGNEIQQAALNNDVKKIVALFNADASCIRETDPVGCVALHYAARYGHEEAIDTLHKLNSTLLDAVDDHGWTSMHYAAVVRKKNAVLALHLHGSEAHFCKTKLGNPPVDLEHADGESFTRQLYFSRSLAEVLFFTCVDDDIKSTRRR